jgi:branched-chain amino acid transport system ATP-binding protein
VLVISDLHAWYDRSHVLQGVSLQVKTGQIVSLIGRNGAGKTTTLRSVLGVVARCTGSVRFHGEELLGLPVHERFRRGLGYVPEERRIVPGLTVRENLELGLVATPRATDRKAALQRAAALFPRLADRLDQVAETMSGGEQQMLAIARAMASEPRMLMLDEPTEGIMPILVDELAEQLLALKRAGTTILLVEQNVELALGLSDHAYIIDQGTIVHAAEAKVLLADTAIQERYCSV